HAPALHAPTLHAPPPDANPPGPRPRKPRGKIAELPKPQRAMINGMLDSGKPYRVIQAETAKRGVSLNAENISNWFASGYQDYVRHQEWLEQVNSLRENASD